VAARGIVGLFLAPVLVQAQAVSVEIRNSEVWLAGHGPDRQLTHDGKAKVAALLSPAGNRIAYWDLCPQAERCTPSVVILDLEGHRLQSFKVKLASAGPDGTCASILSIAWAGDGAIAAECHLNPSLSEYVVTDIATGRSRLDLLGYDFTPSPDGRLVAHVGWIIHFAPPSSQSEYLQIGNTTVYPQLHAKEPYLAPRIGNTYVGIHDFMPGFFWSPDSTRVAFIDCTYDWTPDSPEALSAAQGRESNWRCALAVARPDGESTRFPLPDASPEDLGAAHLRWITAHKLSIEATGHAWTFEVG